MRMAIITVTAMITNVSLLRLLQLSSASLPVGGYSFSQGLEYAIDNHWVHSEEDVKDWLTLLMNESLAQTDLPLLIRLMESVAKKDTEAYEYWNAYALACRETMELHLTEAAMGDALARLLSNLDIVLPIQATRPTSFIAAFSVAAVTWKIEQNIVLVGYLWSWLENQIAAATKLVPLGQTAAQRLLVVLGEEIDTVIAQSKSIDDNNIGSSLPGLAMASSWHETQYSRLFRS